MSIRVSVRFHRCLLSIAAVGFVAGAFPTRARAQVSGYATGNATVNPTGPRTGTSGTNFFNAEGSGNNANATFGVLDFSAGAFGLGTQTVTGVQGSLTLTLTESDAAFTAPGTLEFYLTTANASSIVAGSSALKYQPTTANGTSDPPWGIDPLLGSSAGNANGTIYDLGSGAFTTTGNTNTGGVDTYTLSLSSTAAMQAFVNSLGAAGGSKLRLIVAATTPATMAATFYGYTGTAAGGSTVNVHPKLSFTPVFSTVNNLYWEAASATWTASGGTNFNTTNSAPGTMGWNNDGTHLAVFAANVGSTVSVDSGINAAALQFDVGGYTLNPLAAGNTLTLAGSTPFVQVTNANDTATVNVALGGTAGLNKTGAGTLVLGGANTYTGTTTVSAGTLQVSADGALGDPTATLTLAGGTLQSGLTAAGSTLTLARAVSGTGGLGTASGTTLAISGVVNAGTITLPGAGSVTFTNTGTASVVAGLAFQTAGGSVQAQNAGQLGGLGTVNLGTGGITATQTTGNVSASGIFQPSGTTVPMAVANAGASLSVNGYFSGAATLVKTGAGTLIINSDNSMLNGAGTGTASLRQGSVGTANGGVVSIGAANPNPNYALGTGEYQANGGTVSNDTGAAVSLAISDISLGAQDSTATPGGLVFAGNAPITVAGGITLYKGATNAYQHVITVNTPTVFTGIFGASATATTSTGVTISGSSTLTLNGTAANTFKEPVTIATSGAGAGVFAAANGAFGANARITLNAGATLTINTGVTTGTVDVINDAGVLAFNGAAGTFGNLALAIGTATETVGGLFLAAGDGTLAAGYQPAGLYGPVGSPAGTIIDANLFSGSGLIMNLGTAVPEPSAWAAWLAGMCGLAAAMFRHGRRA